MFTLVNNCTDERVVFVDTVIIQERSTEPGNPRQYEPYVHPKFCWERYTGSITVVTPTHQRWCLCSNVPCEWTHVRHGEFRQSIQKLIDDATQTLNAKLEDALTKIDEKISSGVVGFPALLLALEVQVEILQVVLVD